MARFEQAQPEPVDDLEHEPEVAADPLLAYNPSKRSITSLRASKASLKVRRYIYPRARWLVWWVGVGESTAAG